jgi:SAM-dependent methyltransferase
MVETTTPSVDITELREAVRTEYAAVAQHPDRGFHFHTGRGLAVLLRYPPEWIDELPTEAVDSMAGTGNPFALGTIGPGEHVVDCGSGAGADSLIAARLVTPDGAVIGVDMTPEMLARARTSLRSSGLGNVEFREGLLESLPVDSGWADVVISNGALNLVPDKAAALGEMFRVLRPGGRLQVVDIVLASEVPADAKADVTLWTGCIAGGLLSAQLSSLVAGAGFVDVEILPGEDVFAGAPQESSAAEFGTVSVGIRGRKP